MNLSTYTEVSPFVVSLSNHPSTSSGRTENTNKFSRKYLVKYTLPLFVSIFMMCNTSFADTPTGLLQGYQQQAKTDNPAFTGFNATRGQQFFNQKHGNDWSCASCHTTNPKQMGKHDLTGRTIQPMAPIANQQRFTDSKKSEKWFRRNCKDVLSRECTAQEKGDVLTYLLSIK